MSKSTITADLCIIGAGSGGLSVAAGAAQMGADVVLIERGLMGGDCLNYGCVPSKSLIAAAHAAHTVRHSGRFGVNGHEPEIDFARVHGHVKDVIAGIAPHDSVERFEALGVRVIQGEGRFTGPREVEAASQRIRARRFVIATGSRAFIPPVPGMEGVPYLTNESVFELSERPDHLLVMGGGPIGVELAQAFRRLGAAVSVIQRGAILPKDDPDAAQVVRRSLCRDGVALHERAEVEAVSRDGNGIAIRLVQGGETRRLRGSHLLVAAGRQANVERLNLEAAGIELGPRGIAVDARLRTSNRRVFAIGDVAGGLQFTHLAGYHAGIVIRNALFRLPASADHSAVPWVTYTAPELAHVGLSESEARERLGDKLRVTRFDLEGNDRARAELETDGFVKVMLGAHGRVLGATIVGHHAGELLHPWILMVQKGMKIGDMAGAIAPYPTLSESSKRAAGNAFTPTLFSARTRRVVRFLQALP